MAGEAAEHTVTFALAGRVLAARGEMQKIVDNLNHAITYLTTAGTFPQLLAYVEDLKKFYTDQAGKMRIVNMRDAKAIGADIYNAQGSLLAADPFVGIFSEQYRASTAGHFSPLQGTPALHSEPAHITG